MTKRWLFLVSLLCAYPAVASAQTTGVTITLSSLTLEEQRINIEDLEEDEENPAPIRLSWQVAGLGAGAFDYELTYGAITQTSTTPPRLRVIESDSFAEAQGDQPAGVQLRVELFLRDVIADADDLPPSLGGFGRNDYDEAICVNVFPAGNPDFNQTTSQCWTFEVDTLAPVPPQITELVPGENRVQVRWERINDNDIEFYEIVYCTNASTLTVSFETLPCTDPRASGTISDTLSEASISDGILNGERVAVALRSIDDFDNVGDTGGVEAVFPTSVDDFFELYDGNEDGGFCFIATAAYGSYAHPLVRVLRAFRDGVLKRTAVGEVFVWAYYRYAPPIANRVAADPTLAGWIRLWLVPVAILAIVIMLSPFIAMFWLGRLAWRSRGNRRAGAKGASVARTAALILAGASVLLGFSGVAQATRPESDLSVVGIGLEFKGGPYSGAIQEETGFSEVFPAESRPMFTLGVDVQVFRGFGTATVGSSIGYVRYSGLGLFGKGSPTPGTPSSDSNAFSLIPLTLQVGYRFDVLADNTWIPL
ncbi:MAG: CFI-box-CTERM domain-containing protein, partial [Myxococcota bacterium]